jgi:transposase
MLTRQMRATVSRIAYFTSQIVSLSNRLRAVLLRYYPAALEVFSSHRTKIALAFIQRYPTPDDARTLSFDEFAAFTQEQHYKHPQRIATCYQRLQDCQMQSSPDTVHVYQEEVVQLAKLLQTMMQVKADALTALTTCFHQHPDQFIFASLPGTGQLLAPALLSKFGDDRQRFPSPAHVQALAGTCPVTEQSGKRRIIRFRRACDKDFRTFAQQWARSSLKQSAWAEAYWQRARPRCASNSHALRCLANRWLAVAWKLWQDRIPYDESYHLKQSLAHRRPHH